jgi:hypothetical protein
VEECEQEEEDVDVEMEVEVEVEMVVVSGANGNDTLKRDKRWIQRNRQSQKRATKRYI